MLICIFLLLSITITFYILFGNINIINGGFCHLVWPQSLGFLLHPYCSFADSWVFILIYCWMICLSSSALSVWESRDNLFVLPVGSLGQCIKFLNVIFITLSAFVFLGMFWNTVDMSVYLLSVKLFEIQLLTNTFLQTQPITVCQVLSFYGNTHFSAYGHTKTLPIVSYHSEWHVECLSFSGLLILFFPFLPSRSVSLWETVQFPCYFFLLLWFITVDTKSDHWTFHFRVLGYLYP